MPKLELLHLNKAYSDTIVPVKDLSLTVNEHEFLTLVGPSGCGKSTILRLIAGLEQPTQGQVVIGDRDVSALPPGDRNMAMVFQSYALYPHMTVRQNIASGLKLRHFAGGEIQKRVHDASRILGLDELLDRKPAKLSGGQRQRVALARALVRQPDVFLLDEPLSNLDALLREQVRADLKQLFADQKSPIVYVTHDQTEAMTLSSQVAVLSDGHLQQLGSPEDIYKRPANRFVAGFIGSPQMNLLRCERVGQTVMLGETPLPAPVGSPDQQTVVVGIRPEDVRLPQEGDPILLSGDVFLVENLGMAHLVSLRLPGSNPVTLRALLPPDATWSREHLQLAFPLAKLHWFNAETGARLEG